MEVPKFDLAPIVYPAQPKDMESATGDLGIVAIGTTQRHMYGRRFLNWDGSVYKYFASVGSTLAGFGAANGAPQNIGAVAPAAMAAGAREISVTIASGDGYAADGAIAQNELAGGYLICGHGESLVQNRLILANTAVASGGGTCRLLLQFPISNAMTASSSYVEVGLNPYKHLTKGALEYNAFMGVPVVNTASGYKGWCQTWGPCWVTPGGADGTPGDTANDRQAYFVGDGSVNFGYALTIENGYQKAGFCIDKTASGSSAMPLIMLQISI